MKQRKVLDREFKCFGCKEVNWRWGKSRSSVSFITSPVHMINLASSLAKKWAIVATFSKHSSLRNGGSRKIKSKVDFSVVSSFMTIEGFLL